MASKSQQQKKESTVAKDVIDIGLEQITLEMSKLLKDFHKNLRNLSLISLDIKQPIMKYNKSIKGAPILKALPAPNSSTKTKKSNSSKMLGVTKKQQQHKFVNKPVICPTKKNQPSLPAINTLRALKETVEKAKQERKTFTVCGNYHTIRRALLERGWIEKIRLSYNTRDRENFRRLQSMSINELITKLNDKEIGNACKRMIMSKLLYQHQVDFYWDDFNDAFKVNNDKVKYTLINRFKRTIFSYTSKQGLCEAVKRAHWYQNPGKSLIRHPRSYSLTDKGDPKEFISDYKITAAISLLKWIVATSKQQKLKLLSENGKIPLATFYFALEECVKIIKKSKHEDIDCEIEEALDYQWDQFLDHYQKLVHIGNHFKIDKGENEASIVQKAQYILNKLEMYNPDLDMDGMMNIWILKPVAGSRGQGIHICRTLQYIFQVIKSNTNMRYIVQKYIEKPLLIYNTKFDIRQWFLISSSCPLTIWIYKECYLRFSSQTFNLRKLHEAIHLTNNSVQAKYRNTGRDIALPNYNMWDCNQFKNYLKDIGYPNVFEKVIYPGMKQCITGAILLNQDNIDTRRNSFELYGADFMLTEDFQPWLIEINAKPALYASTPVTARMCPQVLDDLIKVIIDLPHNAKTKTGNFELLYKQNIPKMPQVDVETLKLEGIPLNKDYFYEPENNEVDLTTMSKESVKINEIQDYITKVNTEMNNALKNLLDVIDKEKERRQKQVKKKNNEEERIVGIIEEYRYGEETKLLNINNTSTFQNVMRFLKNSTNYT